VGSGVIASERRPRRGREPVRGGASPLRSTTAAWLM